MRVFVLCTGRCGSMTFAKACCHATNYRSLHEPDRHKPWSARSQPADRTIYVDNRLAWFPGRLLEWLRDDDLLVWLYRDRAAVRDSFAKRWKKSASIVRAYADALLLGAPHTAASIDDYLDAVESNARLLLRSVPVDCRFEFAVEQASEQWPEFWRRIAAVGDASAGLQEFNARHNASPGNARRTADKLAKKRAKKRLLATNAAVATRKPSHPVQRRSLGVFVRESGTRRSG